MQNNFKNIEFLKRITTSNYESFLKLQPMIPFSPEIEEYLDALSKALNEDPLIRKYPDVSAFSFFCRKANISLLKKKFYDSSITKLGRGLVFHIAPSNVPVNFAFSLVMGLLSGNSNILRVPSKKYDQVDIIIKAINKLSKVSKYSNISDRIILVRYDRDSNATKKFSLNCDVRVIWGGDETINEIRKNTLQPRAFDITFADRYSICIINGSEFVNEPKPERVVEGFYNDTYLFDQNACTSAHLILWVGTKNKIEKAKNIFWEKLHILVDKRYEIQPVAAIDKLTNFYKQAIETENLTLENIKNNLILRAKLSDLREDIDSFRSHSGYFSEYHSSSVLELSKIINRKYQTLAYYGFSKEEMKNYFHQLKPVGIDRIVPIGRTLEFSLIWDSYNIINSLSRSVEIL
tara:strand:+ start:3610 stop:4824 length:1215 start_codon:yes stop_codon:yes gene_type:complete